MGHALQPGGFAPFSLRFGVQPPGISTYNIILGSEGSWQPRTDVIDLPVTNTSRTEPDGRLFISGQVSNPGNSVLEQIRVVATIFDAEQNVIAAGFSDVAALLDRALAMSLPCSTPVHWSSIRSSFLNWAGLRSTSRCWRRASPPEKTRTYAEAGEIQRAHSRAPLPNTLFS